MKITDHEYQFIAALLLLTRSLLDIQHAVPLVFNQIWKLPCTTKALLARSSTNGWIGAVKQTRQHLAPDRRSWQSTATVCRPAILMEMPRPSYHLRLQQMEMVLLPVPQSSSEE